MMKYFSPERAAHAAAKHPLVTLGVWVLVIAAAFMGAAAMAPDGKWALVCLSLAYAGILAQQPNLCALCLDTGRAG